MCPSLSCEVGGGRCRSGRWVPSTQTEPPTHKLSLNVFFGSSPPSSHEATLGTDEVFCGCSIFPIYTSNIPVPRLALPAPGSSPSEVLRGGVCGAHTCSPSPGSHFPSSSQCGQEPGCLGQSPGQKLTRLVQLLPCLKNQGGLFCSRLLFSR